MARSSTLGSRASSRSTVLPQSDSEASDHQSQRVRRIHHRSRENDPDASWSRSKRNRSPESGIDTEPQAKRIRLRRASTERFRAVSSPFPPNPRSKPTTRREILSSPPSPRVSCPYHQHKSYRNLRKRATWTSPTQSPQIQDHYRLMNPLMNPLMRTMVVCSNRVFAQLPVPPKSTNPRIYEGR